MYKNLFLRRDRACAGGEEGPERQITTVYFGNARGVFNYWLTIRDGRENFKKKKENRLDYFKSWGMCHQNLKAFRIMLFES